MSYYGKHWMRAIIIGAGRGQRLMPTTAEAPKCYAEVQGKRLLDWALEAFSEAGLTDICFIGGYKIEKIRQDYPQFQFRHNKEWEKNNILASLMYAEDLMEDGFVCCYSDTLFSGQLVRKALVEPGEILLSVDTKWLDRYQFRSQHPPDDAEKVTVTNNQVTRIHRGIPITEAYGEFTGLAKFSAAGAAELRKHYHHARSTWAGKPYREAVSFEKAYLILLLQEMIEAGVPMAHSDTAGEYMEVDTQQDFELARQHWKPLKNNRHT
jgi:choline kinase